MPPKGFADVKFKVRVTPDRVDEEYVSEFVELYFATAGHQRVNLLPEEARELCRELMEKGYAPGAEGKVLVRMSFAKWRELMEQEPGEVKVVQRPVPACQETHDLLRGLLEHKMQCGLDEMGKRISNLRDELLPELQDYVDEVVRDNREAARNHLEQLLAEEAKRLGLRLDAKLIEEVARAQRLGKGGYLHFTKNFEAARQASTRDVEQFTKEVKGSLKRREGRRLTYDPRTMNWMDKDGRPWACHRALQEYFGELIKGAKVLRLVDYNYQPLGRTVEVRGACRHAHANPSAVVAEQETEVYPALADWLTAGNASNPCWVGVEVLEHNEPATNFTGKDRPRAASPCLTLNRVERQATEAVEELLQKLGNLSITRGEYQGRLRYAMDEVGVALNASIKDDEREARQLEEDG